MHERDGRSDDEQKAIDAIERLLDECSSSLDAAKVLVPALQQTNVSSDSLFERCNELAARSKLDRDPMRVLHHFACTGGTLISKCLSVMPNTLLLSEVDPFSSLPLGPSRFAPTDLLRLMNASGNALDAGATGDVFLAGLRALHGECLRRGLRLVLREHSHSQFCVAEEARLEPSMTSLLRANFDVLSVVTVRDPLDSYLSLRANGWVHYSPGTLDEYACRYLQFLDVYDDLPVYRYESFVREPLITTRRLCDELDLAFNEDAFDYFSAVSMSGDSGRKSDLIAPRERREIPKEISKEMDSSTLFRRLCDRLGYPFAGKIGIVD